MLKAHRAESVGANCGQDLNFLQFANLQICKFAKTANLAGFDLPAATEQQPRATPHSTRSPCGQHKGFPSVPSTLAYSWQSTATCTWLGSSHFRGLTSIWKPLITKASISYEIPTGLTVFVSLSEKQQCSVSTIRTRRNGAGYTICFIDKAMRVV